MSKWPHLPGKWQRSLTDTFLVTNTKSSPDFIDINGNFLTDINKSKTGLGSVPLSPGALLTLILLRKFWWGNLGAVSVPWGFRWGSVSGWPMNLVSLPSLLTGHVLQSCRALASSDEHSLPGELFALAAVMPFQSFCLFLSSESLANTLEPLQWVAVPQTILFYRRRGSHRNSVTHLCPPSPYPICSFSSLIFYHGFPYNFLWALCLGGDWRYCSLADSKTETFSFRLMLVCSTDRVCGMW